MKIKTFIYYGSELEERVNDWLKENPDITVHYTNLSVKGSSSSYLSYVIMYEEKLKL